MDGGVIVKESTNKENNEKLQQEDPNVEPDLISKDEQITDVELKNVDLTPEPTTEEPEMCCICLGIMVDASNPDMCNHTFCFNCLKKWCEKHSSCPLCVTPFTAIQHNLKGEGQYDSYQLLSPYYNQALVRSVSTLVEMETSRQRTREDQRWEVDFAVYRLWSLTDYDDGVLWRLGYYDLTIARTETGFRRCVYRRQLWVIPPPEGQSRTSTPEYYTENPDELERLKFWLTREMKALKIDIAQLNKFMRWLKTYQISDRLFHLRLYQYLSVTTDHFVHELNCFASSTIDDMDSYDNTVQYTMKRERDPLAPNLWDTPVLDDDDEFAGLQFLFSEGDVNLWGDQQEEHGGFQIESAVRYRAIHNSYGTANEIFDLRGYIDPEQFSLSRMVWFAAFDSFLFCILSYFFYYYTKIIVSKSQNNENV